MKIALVCPSNIIHMPYLKNYTDTLNKLTGIEQTIINWDRFNIEQENYFCFKDNKSGHRRGLLDYYRFSSFVASILRDKEFDRVIVFGLQLTFFLSDFLAKNLTNKYVIDIRDHNIIKRFSSFSRAIEKSSFTVISSPGYKSWLPFSEKYIINHNTNISSLANLSEAKNFTPERVEISCIGALKDISINKRVINSLRNDPKIKLTYRGEGIINDDLSQYIKSKKIRNTYIGGRYNKHEEESLYRSSDLINMFMSRGHINNETCLSNRLYNASIFGIPLVSLSGSIISEVIQENNLGLVVSSLENLSQKIHAYIESFDKETFELGRRRFLSQVITDNSLFKEKITSFAS